MGNFSIEQYNLNIFDSRNAAAKALVSRIIDLTNDVIQKKGSCVWALSGGSSIEMIYDELSEYNNILSRWPGKLKIIWVDERYVSHKSKQSNYGNALNYFWKNYKGIQLIPVPYCKDVAQSAREYDMLLSKEGIEIGDIDITILGMGSDGHTASLFPDSNALNEKRKKVVAVKDSEMSLDRISVTFPMINASRYIFLYFYGPEKAKTFYRALSDSAVNKYPILGIDRCKLEIYTDQYIQSMKEI